MVKTVKHKAEQAQDKAHQVTTSIQDVVDDQKERWEPVIKAGKTAVDPYTYPVGSWGEPGGL